MTAWCPAIGRRLGPAALTVGAVVGGLCLLVTLAGLLGGVRLLVFQSGSMAPDHPAGSLGVSRPVDAAELRVGDVVSVHAGDGTRVTHRVVEIRRTQDRAALTLRGDANGVDDAETYRVTEADRLVLSVPWLGHPVTFLGTRGGLLLLGVLATGLLAYAFRPTRQEGDDRVALSVLVPTAAVVLVTLTAVGTLAAWSDTAEVRSGPLAADTVVSQAQPTCSDEGGLLGVLGSARLTWPHVDTRYEYAYTVVRVSDGDVRASGTVRPDGDQGSTVVLDITSALLDLTVADRDYDVTIRARLAGSPGWTAATATVTRVHSVNLVVGLSMRCGSA